LEVPFSLLLDAGAALRAEDVGSVFAAVKPTLDAVDNRLPLALFMLHELRKPDSFWRPYFGVCTHTLHRRPSAPYHLSSLRLLLLLLP
jgi:hypothetical protein